MTTLFLNVGVLGAVVKTEMAQYGSPVKVLCLARNAEEIRRNLKMGSCRHKKLSIIGIGKDKAYICYKCGRKFTPDTEVYKRRMRSLRTDKR